MMFALGDGASDALDRVDAEIDMAYLYGHGSTPESSPRHFRENRGEVTDSFISTYKRVVHPKPPYSGTWDCRACGKPFGFGQLSEQGYCYDDQVMHLTVTAERGITGEAQG